MTVRLILICAAPTAATRTARFPLDEAPDERGAARLARASPTLAASIAGADRCLTGPERRAQATAAALGRAFDADAALRDQDFGLWAGRGLAEVAGGQPDGMASWMADPAAAPHGGESVSALVLRVEAWMAGQAAAGGRVAAVTHPAVVRAAAAAALEAGTAPFWRIEAPPLARAALNHDGRRWMLTGLTPPP